MDKTSFWWAGLCAICHPGGGPTEFDRDGQLYFDVATHEFGYEKMGRTLTDVQNDLDGDYTEINHMTGAFRVAPWDKTGVAEADCLLCHRADRAVDQGKNLNWVWHAASLRAKDNLVDSQANPVPAFASAATASQGWFSNFALASTPPGVPPMAASFDVDYSVGTANGSLEERGGQLYVAPGAISKTPTDYACWGCHLTPDLKKRGREWFNADSDVHYAGFNNLDDADTGNDIPALESRACTVCHPARSDGMALNHNIAKGNATLGSVRNDTDYTDFLTCAQCHLASSPYKDPDAPTPPSGTVHSGSHLAVFSCEACHVPYKTLPADFVVDNAATGATVGYNSTVFYSADPLDPSNADKSRWYPSFVWKEDYDGQTRIFPVKLLLSVWWGDWDQNGTPSDLADDVIKPIPLWRVRQVTGGAALGVVVDDNGDGKPDVNTTAEILAYITALRGNDSYGNQIAANPVLLKGGFVYHDTGGTIQSFEYHGSGIKTESSHPFSLNHNVRGGGEAIGQSCNDCHGGNSPLFDRPILIDPFDAQGNPVYKTVRELLGFQPPF